jgi:hypothetical protein
MYADPPTMWVALREFLGPAAEEPPRPSAGDEPHGDRWNRGAGVERSGQACITSPPVGRNGARARHVLESGFTRRPLMEQAPDLLVPR